MQFQQLKEIFVSQFQGNQKDIRSFFAPGRVNLIGEHVDYNGGLVLPAALTVGATLLARPRNDGVVRLKAVDLDEIVTAKVTELDKYKDLKWGNYQLGTLLMMQRAGFEVNGADMLYYDTVPHGGGLSSSAANEVVTAYAAAVFSGQPNPDRTQLAKISRQAENEYCGVNCGIMDQFASANGKKDHAILLNCSTLDSRAVPLQLGDCKLLIINTNKKHSLGASKYNERRAECDAALAALKSAMNNITCLAEVSPSDFEQHSHLIKDQTVRKRAAHVVSECARTTEAVRCLESGMLKQFGKLMCDSHKSLKDDFEVSCRELDVLALGAMALDGVLGARMTGAGFGGCTINIVKIDKIDYIKESLAKLYTEETGLTADFYVSEAGDGVGEIG